MLGDNKEVQVADKCHENKHSTNTTTTTQNKTTTATTIKILRQHLKISDNKTRER